MQISFWTRKEGNPSEYLSKQRILTVEEIDSNSIILFTIYVKSGKDRAEIEKKEMIKEEVQPDGVQREHRVWQNIGKFNKKRIWKQR